MTTHLRTARRLAVASAIGAALVAPAAASADSIVHIKDGNVWLTTPDGSKTHQVTTDGSSGSPYRAPSQAENGTIAASRGNEIVVMQQNGEVIRKFDPPALVDSTSHSIDGVPVYVSISPDATKVAYSFASYSCPIGASCAARASSTAVEIDKGGSPSPYGQVYYGDPSWITGSRLMVHGGYLSHVNLWDLGQPDKFHWFDDQDWAGQGNSTDLGDGDLSRDGKLFVGVRGYDSPVDNRYRRIIWFKTTGSPATDTPPPVPDALCITGDEPGSSSPTIAPSGDAFAFAKPDGIQVVRGVYTEANRCGEISDGLFVAGGSQPDWGPADINPQPRSGGSGGGQGGNGGGGNGGGSNGGGQGGNGGGGTGGSGGDGNGVERTSLTVAGTRLRSACKSGLKVKIKYAQPGKTTITVKSGRKTIGKRGVTVKTSGAGTFVVKFSGSGAKSVCKGKSRKVKLTVAAAGAKKVVTLKR